MAFLAKKIAEETLDYAKNKLIDSAKDYLFVNLQEKLKDGDKGIDDLFVSLKDYLENIEFMGLKVLEKTRKTICTNPELVKELKEELKTKIGDIQFSAEITKLTNKMPEMEEQIKALPEKLKEKLNKLIDDVITCEGTPTPPVAVTAAGGSKKKRRQRKTKKRINKRSRGRKRHSRK